jgi:antitoxin component YwqK of YwqJK toxin-antitoxin module
MDNKKQLIIKGLFLILPFILLSNKQPDKLNYSTLSIVLEEKRTSQHFSIINEKSDVHTRNELEYFWYKNNKLNSNFGGFTGNLLHGNFLEFDSNGNLIIKGNYYFGLKNKIWQVWDKDGKLHREEIWNKGWLKKKITYSDSLIYIEKFKNNKLHGSQITKKNDKIIEVKKFRNGTPINEKNNPKKRLFHF